MISRELPGEEQAEQVNLEFDRARHGLTTLFTDEEQTVYYAAVLPEYQSRTVELLSDMLGPSRGGGFRIPKKR